MRLLRWLVGGVVATLFVCAPVHAAELPAIDESRGTPGHCPDGDGVTVVVDFGDLGDDVIVRCAPGVEDRDGLDALRDAGFDVDGVQRYGDSVACRIEGRPAADESLQVDGQGTYREACVDMPPASAYWSYWSAEDGGEWAYSQWGLQNREAINGGFEGWSYSLDGTAATRSAPRIDPVLPEEEDRADTDDSGESSENPGRSESNGRSGDPGSGESEPEGLPMPKKRESSPPPTSGTQDGVRWSGGEDAAQPSAAADDDTGSPAPAIAAAAVIGCLAALIAVTAMRRRSRRTG